MKDFPDHHDAELALKLYELRRDPLLRDSRAQMNQWWPKASDDVVAITKPEHVLRWMGPRFLTMPVCEIDLRVGGTWRYIHRAPDGSEYAFSGVYRELGPPERLISTELYEAMPGHDYLVTLTLEEYAGTTTIRGLARYQSQADRDGHLQSGMEAGMRETYDRLGEHLATMA